MDKNIEFYVGMLEGEILMNLVDCDDADLYRIAEKLIKQESEAKMKSICQAYEVVKHELVG